MVPNEEFIRLYLPSFTSGSGDIHSIIMRKYRTKQDTWKTASIWIVIGTTSKYAKPIFVSVMPFDGNQHSVQCLDVRWPSEIYVIESVSFAPCWAECYVTLFHRRLRIMWYFHRLISYSITFHGARKNLSHVWNIKQSRNRHLCIRTNCDTSMGAYRLLMNLAKKKISGEQTCQSSPFVWVETQVVTKMSLFTQTFSSCFIPN